MHGSFDQPSQIAGVKYWEIIADNLRKAGWSWGCVATVDSNEQIIFVADAHRDDGKRFVVRADEKADGVSGTRIGAIVRKLIHRNLEKAKLAPAQRS